MEWGDQEDAMSNSFMNSDAGWRGRREFLVVAGTGMLGWFARHGNAEEIKLAALIEQAPQTHSLIPALRAALLAKDAVQALADYETVFTKTEMVSRQTLTTRMLLKVRHAPFSIYLKYLDPHAGREAIYVTGQNNNQVVVHDTGLAALVGTLSLDPTSSTAMDGNRHPITQAGMLKLVETVMGQWLEYAQKNVSGMTVNHFPNAKMGDQSCQTIEAILAQPVGANSYQTTRLYMDAASKLPVRVQQYAFPTRRGQKPVLVEDYLFQNIRANLSLADIDFDPHNPRYGY